MSRNNLYIRNCSDRLDAVQKNGGVIGVDTKAEAQPKLNGGQNQRNLKLQTKKNSPRKSHKVFFGVKTKEKEKEKRKKKEIMHINYPKWRHRQELPSSPTHRPPSL